MLASKASRGRPRSNIKSGDPRGMVTTKARGLSDPPQTSTNVTGFKRIRKEVTTAASAGSLTLGDIRTCLPVTGAEIRILKLSAWAGATAQNRLTVVFPVTIPTLAIGDNAVYEDEGTQNSMRPSVHLKPNFLYRNFWFTAAVPLTTVIATFTSIPAIEGLVVDISLEYRTSPQTCPALEAALRANRQ